jgi:phosphatidylglycerophosphate synthase
MSGSHATELRARYEPQRKAASATRATRFKHVLVGQRQANFASLLGAAFCLAAGVSLSVGLSLLVAAVMFPLGGLCDLADGAIARAGSDGSSKAGRFVDSMCDKVGEAALLVGLVLAIDDQLVVRVVVVAFTFGWLASYTKAVAGEHLLDADWPEARLFGRAGRVILLSATLLLAATFTGAQHQVFVMGFGALLMFNAASFVCRASRVVSKFR